MKSMSLGESFITTIMIIAGLLIVSGLFAAIYIPLCNYICKTQLWKNIKNMLITSGFAHRFGDVFPCQLISFFVIIMTYETKDVLLPLVVWLFAFICFLFYQGKTKEIPYFQIIFYLGWFVGFICSNESFREGVFGG